MISGLIFKFFGVILMITPIISLFFSNLNMSWFYRKIVKFKLKELYQETYTALNVVFLITVLFIGFCLLFLNVNIG